MTPSNKYNITGKGAGNQFVFNPTVCQWNFKINHPFIKGLPLMSKVTKYRYLIYIYGLDMAETAPKVSKHMFLLFVGKLNSQVFSKRVSLERHFLKQQPYLLVH